MTRVYSTGYDQCVSVPGVCVSAAALAWLTVYPSHRGLVPLHNACSYGHYEVTELLVKHGANVNVADLWKFTPLHEAAAKGKYEIVKLLLKVGLPGDGLRGSYSFGRLSHRVRKVAHFPIFMNLELLFCEIFDCKE